jgi:hypothetical protein
MSRVSCVNDLFTQGAESTRMEEQQSGPTQLFSSTPGCERFTPEMAAVDPNLSQEETVDLVRIGKQSGCLEEPGDNDLICLN